MQKLEKFKTQALGFPSRANRMIVHDDNTLSIANDFVLEVKALIKEVAESYDPIISHAKAEKKKYIDPLKESLQTVKFHIASYLEEQARIQREAEEKARKKEEDRQKKEERMLAEAKILDDSGKEEEAAAIIEEIPLPEPIEDVPYPAVEGVSLKRIVDTEKINRIVESTKGRTRIPGIKIYPVWKWDIIDRKLIPEVYYKSISASREK